MVGRLIVQLSAGRFHGHPPVKGLNGEESCGSGAHSMRDMSVDQAFYTIPYLFKVAHWRPCLRRIPGRRFLATTAWMAGWRRRLTSTRSCLPATKLTERAI